jgi:hypothetical protein
MSQHRKLLLMLLIGTSAFGPIGCQSSSLTSEHQDEEAHEQPAHMPVSFAAAVADLPHRLEMLETTSKAQAQARSDQIHELEDIIRWLPELAGDSDLRKSDWESAKRLSDELEKLLALWFAQADQRAAPVPACDSILEALKRLAEKSQSVQEAVWK